MLKISRTTFIIISVMFFAGMMFSCSNKSKTKQHKLIESYHPSKNDSIQEISDEQRLKQTSANNKFDSLCLDSALKDALRIARKAFFTTSFTKNYEFVPNDSSFIIKIEIQIGNIFNDNQKYLLIRRHVPSATHLNIYRINNGKTDQVINRIQDNMTYIRDTIFDANGDGYNDFLVHWYPSSGCCVRNVYNVYLNQPKKHEFSKDYEFINPTFSAKEKVIRGLEYGHPGDVGLYKFKWNGLQVDTIEFIYPDAKKSDQYIKTKKRANTPTQKDGIVLKSVPKEYQKLDIFKWF